MPNTTLLRPSEPVVEPSVETMVEGVKIKPVEIIQPGGSMPSIGALLADIPVISKAQFPKPEHILTPFEPDFEACDVHGSYPVNMRDRTGHVRRMAGGCPHCKKQKNAHRLLAASNFPKRFASCDFGNYQTSTEHQKKVLDRCVDYANNFPAFHASGACLILCGTPGTGKNHLATAISKRVLELGFTVLRIKASEYLDAYWSKSFEEREAWVKGMAAVDLLMIDELGRSSQAKSAQDAFFRILDARYEAQLPNLLATNLNREGLIEVLGDATYDRMTQGGGGRMTLNWASYRAGVGVEA